MCTCKLPLWRSSAIYKYTRACSVWGFLEFLDFSVCPWAAGEQALWSCHQRCLQPSVSAEVGRGGSPRPAVVLRGCRVQSKGNPLPQQQGKETAGSWPEGSQLSLLLFSPCCLLSLTPSCFSLSRFLSSLLSFPHSSSHSIHHTMSPSQQLH